MARQSKDQVICSYDILSLRALDADPKTNATKPYWW